MARKLFKACEEALPAYIIVLQIFTFVATLMLVVELQTFPGWDVIEARLEMVFGYVP